MEILALINVLLASTETILLKGVLLVLLLALVAQVLYQTNASLVILFQPISTFIKVSVYQLVLLDGLVLVVVQTLYAINVILTVKNVWVTLALVLNAIILKYYQCMIILVLLLVPKE